MKLLRMTLRKMIAGVVSVSLITAGMQMTAFAGEVSENPAVISDNEASESENSAAVSGNAEEISDVEKTVSEDVTVSDDDAQVEEDITETDPEDTDTDAAGEAENSVLATPESDFEWSGNTITKYTGTGGDIIIPKRADKIAANAFSGKSISSLKFEEGSVCSEIGYRAFYGCGITSLELPDSLTKIEGSCFTGNKMSSVTLPRLLQTMGDGVFENCTTITSVSVKSVALNEVGSYYGTFPGAPLTEIIFDSNVKSVPPYLFRKAELSNTDLVLPQNITAIGDGAFTESNLKSVTFKGNITSIGSYAFSHTKFENINLGSSIKILKDGAFDHSALTKIDLPDTITTVGQWAFSCSEGLKEINYNIPKPEKWGLSVFGGDTNIEKVNFGNNVKYIPPEFAYKVNLGKVSLKIPSSVTEIGNYAFYDSNLSDVVFEGNNLKKIENAAFQLCPIKELNLPSSVEVMEGDIFGSNSVLSKVVVPQKLIVLENYTFEKNKSLEKVAIYKDTKINGDPFYECSTAILTIYGYAGSEAEKYAKSKGYTFKLISEWGNENPYGKDSSSGKGGETGSAVVNGEPVTSLKSAFKKMNEEKEYEIELLSDMDGEKNLTIPKKAKKVTIKGNGNTVKIIGTKLTSNADLVLDNVTFRAVNKKGNPVKFTVDAKKALAVKDNVIFDNSATVIKTGKELELSGNLGVEQVNAGSLKLAKTGLLTVNKNFKVTVRGTFDSDGGSIKLGDGFNKPITLNGDAKGTVRFSGVSLEDGKQVLTAKKKRIDDEALKNVFDVAGITGNTGASHLYYYKTKKAGIFGDNIKYNGKDYGLWKDALAQMNLDKSSGTDTFAISLNGDVNAAGPLKMPKKGYNSLSIEGNGHTITFTGNITLTGDTTVKDLTFRKINSKGQQVNGKVIKKNFSYTGPETF